MLTRVHPRTAVLAASLLAAASLAAGGTAVASPHDSRVPGVVRLDTAQETTGSNTGANGVFFYRISGTSLCYTLIARRLSADAVAAHIHHGPRTVAGPFVIPLTVGSGTTFVHRDCTSASADLLADILANPKDYYVNVHTPTFPGGEIRGQLA